MEPKEKICHPLSLKVMRLTPPTLSSPVIVTCEPKDLPGNLMNASLKNDISSVSNAESIGIGQFLLVPQNFGSIYLGESFSCYICVHNDSENPINKVFLKADLKTKTQKISLLKEKMIDILLPKHTLSAVIQHEVKEIGDHMLMCEVTYSDNMSFVKCFSFPVMKPLDVITKFYTAEHNEVYLETQIQNITSGPICLEKVELESSNYFHVKSLNKLENSMESIFNKTNVLDKDASRQYLYCLKSKEDTLLSRMKGDSITIGNLDIVWRSNFGQRGHLQTSPLQSKLTNIGDIRLSLINLPNIVLLEEPFHFTCRILNISNHEIHITLCLEDGNSFSWCEISGKITKKVKPSEYVDVILTLIPLHIGLQEIGGIRLRDASSTVPQVHEFDNLGQVFVLAS